MNSTGIFPCQLESYNINPSNKSGRAIALPAPPPPRSLASGDSLFCTNPLEYQRTLPPLPNGPSPQIMIKEWLTTLYEVLHEEHTIKPQADHPLLVGAFVD